MYRIKYPTVGRRHYEWQQCSQVSKRSKGIPHPHLQGFISDERTKYSFLSSLRPEQHARYATMSIIFLLATFCLLTDLYAPISGCDLKASKKIFHDDSGIPWSCRDFCPTIRGCLEKCCRKYIDYDNTNVRCYTHLCILEQLHAIYC